MATNLWAHENLKALKASCESDLIDQPTDMLFELYLKTQQTRKATTALELSIFKVLVFRFSEITNGSISTQKFQGEIKRKLNTKVDQELVSDLLKSESMSPVANFGVNPFRVKFEVDKKAMDRLREEEPEYYVTVIAPMLEVTPGKPGLDVVYTGEGDTHENI